MRLNRRENTRRNILIGEIDKVTGILFPFAVRTMIIHMIGAEYLGLTSLYYSILQMLNLMELGTGTALTYTMYKPIAENDNEMMNALLRYYRNLYRWIGLAVAAAGLLALPFLPRLIHGEVPADINIYYLFLIYLSNVCVNYFLFPQWKALMTAYQRDDLGGIIHIFTQGSMYLAQAAAVYLTRDYYLYALMLPVSSVLYSILSARKAKRTYPQYTCSGSISHETRRDLRQLIAGLMIRKVASLSRDAFDSMFISTFLGLTLTAVYANYYYIMDSVVMIVAVVKTSMAGGVGNSIALDTAEKNRQDLHRIDFLFMWASGWCAICLLCLYQPFMRIWVGSAMTLPAGYAALFAVYFYVLKMADIRTLYSESAGIWWQVRYISIAEGLTNLLLNWLLIRWMGLAGIVIATMISYFVFNFIGGAVILYRQLFLKTGGLKIYFCCHFQYALVCAAAAAVTYGAGSLIPAGGVVELILKASLCIIVPNLIFLLIYRKTEAFRNSRELLDSFLKGLYRK